MLMADGGSERRGGHFNSTLYKSLIWLSEPAEISKAFVFLFFDRRLSFVYLHNLIFIRYLQYFKRSEKDYNGGNSFFILVIDAEFN